MTYVSTTHIGAKETTKIIDWYLTMFEYNRITTFHTQGTWGKGYHLLCDNDINSIKQCSIYGPPTGHSEEHELRFLFKTIEDKMLFDLTWK